MNPRIPLTMAVLTLRESMRRRVVWAVTAMTLVLLALSAWGFQRIAADFDTFTSGEERLVASQVLNLVLFGLSLIAALGTAFLAGPTLAGEIESGMALAVLARPVRRSEVLLGKWLGLAAFGATFVTVAGLAQLIIVRITTGYWPASPVTGLALLAAQTIVLLTLGLLLATAVSPMASGIVAVGLFGATWIAGVVGTVGESLDNPGVARVGTVSRLLLPTDGLWRGAMHAFQDSGALLRMSDESDDFLFLSKAPLTLEYVAWVLLWVGAVAAATLTAFGRRDL